MCSKLTFAIECILILTVVVFNIHQVEVLPKDTNKFKNLIIFMFVYYFLFVYLLIFQNEIYETEINFNYV